MMIFFFVFAPLMIYIAQLDSLLLTKQARKYNGVFNEDYTNMYYSFVGLFIMNLQLMISTRSTPIQY